MTTFADGTAIMSSDQDPTTASQNYSNISTYYKLGWNNEKSQLIPQNPHKEHLLQEELSAHKLASITSPYLSKKKLNTYD
jgi:hypothetical protein